MKLKLTIGSQTFNAELNESPSARRFKSLLPLKIKMLELNGNEKYADLGTDMNTSPTNVRNISAGDLMIYENSVLVIFYKSFATRYHYTPLGRIVDTTGLEDALGKKDVYITFERI